MKGISSKKNFVNKLVQHQWLKLITWTDKKNGVLSVFCTLIEVLGEELGGTLELQEEKNKSSSDQPILRRMHASRNTFYAYDHDAWAIVFRLLWVQIWLSLRCYSGQMRGKQI